MPDFDDLIANLKDKYGEPQLPPARGPFELVLWENACYLLPDIRRAAVFEALRNKVGLSPEAILNANRGTLFTLATMGGMRPDERVFRWLEIARITLTQYDGDLDRILSEPYDKAKKALKQFPTIGDPGAEKILMFCGIARGLPLESNGMRVLTRVGFGKEEKNYSATYRSVQEALKDQLPPKAKSIVEAHILLRTHGKETCKTNAPLCHSCEVSDICGFPQKRLKIFNKTIL